MPEPSIDGSYIDASVTVIERHAGLESISFPPPIS